MYYVYALVSLKYKNKIYIGMTKNIALRIKGHNLGSTKTTKAYRPWILFYSESVKDRLEARFREKKLKSGSGREFLKRILQNVPVAQLDRAVAF